MHEGLRGATYVQLGQRIEHGGLADVRNSNNSNAHVVSFL